MFFDAGKIKHIILSFVYFVKFDLSKLYLELCKFKLLTMRLIVFKTILLLITTSTLLRAQTYDQLKIQNQFEGYYGNKVRNTKINNERLGSEYLMEEWLPVTVRLKDGEVKFDQAKINIHDGTLEVIYKDREKFISGRYIEFLDLFYRGKTRRFIPAFTFKENGKALSGFLEVIKENVPAVYVYHHTYLRKPNPHANIAGGYTVDRLLKISENYIYDGENLHKIKNKKTLKKLFPNSKSEIDEIIRKKSIDIDKAEDLSNLLKDLSLQYTYKSHIICLGILCGEYLGLNGHKYYS